jgi:hypothetical protein
MGKFLENVKYIITEVYQKPSFEGEFLYPEIKKFLVDRGFSPVQDPFPNSFITDVVFINQKKLQNSKKAPSIR